MKKALWTILSIVIIVVVSFYLQTKIAHHEKIKDGEVTEKYKKEVNHKTNYYIFADGRALKIKDHNTWNLIHEGEHYDIEYEYSDAHPPVVKFIGSFDEKGGSGH
ncbi:hypothetical protein [Pontibacillus marinus]|uniref:Uncharacterized protein n=1 Tax=Pontibacillus marinus BH030004 = DSM 16465 TaxID=1385511 RepID=A0A0A5G2M7_9BACI|nr:hypothetical protein [Pontibacillus marinus]KGX86294.1 hypothetical protein N783_12350 [Pontibacillus marinus BH030004 = DSM 16465]